MGGISILGTSGVVRPMSDEALRESLYVELKMRISQGWKDIAFTFGNQGEEAMKRLFPNACIVQISNEVGFMLDSALELGAEHVLLGGHPGKLSKVAAGVMQTHSKYGDARLEAIITHLARLKAPVELIESVYACKTTDAAMKLIHEAGYYEVWNLMAYAAQKFCSLRVRCEINIDIVYLDAQGNIIGKTME